MAVQRHVVDHFNVGKRLFFQDQVDDSVGHAGAIDRFFEHNRMELGYDVILFLDVDCIPLSKKAIEHYLERAACGVLIGNIQRSNHIENDQHVFAAPSALAISVETYLKLGCPSAAATRRGDVVEELTFRAEERGVPVEMVLPSRFDRAPVDCESWALKDGMPVYGCGTTYTDPQLGDLFWHCFQIVSQQRFFRAKCIEVLRGVLNE